MVKCDFCGRTDGCSYHNFGELLLCFKCYRQARDQEPELRRKAEKCLSRDF